MFEPIKLFQYNTLGALMSGLYGGTMTIRELLQYGDLGIGTLDSIDGELIVLDGKAYQAKGSGEVPEVVEVDPSETVPGENLFRSIKIHGDFSHMRVRMIPKSTSDRKFAEVAVNQPEYSKENVTGTIVGIWTPEIFHGVSLAGYHLHFVSDDLSFGGHVMDFVIKEGIVELGAIDQLDQRFPVQDRDYLFAKFNMDEMKEDIDRVE